MFSKELTPSHPHSARMRKVDILYGDKLDFKDMKFPLRVGDILKIGRKISPALVLLVLKLIKNNQSKCQNNVVKINKLIHHWQKKKTTSTFFLSKIWTHSCIIIFYILLNNRHIAMSYKKTALKSMVTKG